MNSQSTHYHPLSKILHWLVASLIVLQFLLAQLAERAQHLDQTLRQLALLANHKSVGITILGLAAIRLLWRLIESPPALPDSMPRWQSLASQVSHWVLYLLLFALPITGWLMSSASAYSVSWFNLFQLPDLVSADPGLKASMEQIHEILAKTLFLLAAVHIVAAIKHGVVDRDGVFQRMLSITSLLFFVGLLVAGILSLTSPGKSAITRSSAETSLGASAVPEIRPEFRSDNEVEIGEAMDSGLAVAVEVAETAAAPEISSPAVPKQNANSESVPPLLEPEDKVHLVAWNIDYEGSYIRFVGDQAGARFTGEWTSWEAAIYFSAADLAASSFDVTVDTRQVDTQDEDRDTTMQDPDWFDSANHPLAHYRASRFERLANDAFVADGQLFIKGQPVPVELNFTVTGNHDRRVVEGTGVTRLLSGNALLDRLALGLGLGEWEDTTWVGQEVTVEVRVEAVVPDTAH
ncbi:MAG: cytochrome b/b6 domain-containing protein [Lysobacterales bacterium]